MRLRFPLPLRPCLPPALLALAVSGCAGIGQPETVVYERETFDVRSAFARSFPVPPPVACDAARRSLLSQGYVVHQASAEQVGARKSFQPRGDSHVQIEFSVVCAADGAGRGGSTAFVSAVQDRYALKKVSASASVGVGPFGSLSVPFSAGDDSLVKVASETIPAGSFYQRFFDLLEHHLAELDEGQLDPAERPAAAAALQGGRDAGASR
jgi:hypothetical protein